MFLIYHAAKLSVARIKKKNCLVQFSERSWFAFKCILNLQVRFRSCCFPLTNFNSTDILKVIFRESGPAMHKLEVSELCILKRLGKYGMFGISDEMLFTS